MPDQKPAKEQNPIAWLLGFKETDAQRQAREAREERERRTKAAVTTAIKSGLPAVKKVVSDNTKK